MGRKVLGVFVALVFVVGIAGTGVVVADTAEFSQGDIEATNPAVDGEDNSIDRGVSQQIEFDFTIENLEEDGNNNTVFVEFDESFTVDNVNSVRVLNQGTGANIGTSQTV